MNTKKVLFIAYAFPPSGGSGVQRTSKFIKYLPAFNWEPIVLTVNQELEMTDRQLLNDIPTTVQVIKTFTLAPPESLKHYPFLDYFYKFLTWLSVPDLGIWWLPSAVWAGIHLLRQNKISAIYATGNPFSTFIIGVILKKIFKLPLIIDFRDPWTLNPHRLPRKPYVLWRDYIEKKLEFFCIKNADKVLSVNRVCAQLFFAEYKKTIEKKFAVITNGFDPEDFESYNQKNNGIDFVFTDNITVLYMGTTNANITPIIFLKGVQHLVQERPELKTKLKCLFVGNNQPIHLPELSNIIHWRGYVNHCRAINLIHQADILLLLTGASSHVSPAKLFEYVATGKPVLALAPEDGAVADVLNQVNMGMIVSPADPKEVSSGLAKLIDENLSGRVNQNTNWEAINRYSRRNTAGQLAAILDEVTD